ncbi:hypothetical protein NDK37_12565 [Xanthomonas citri pv. glycines]|uniref:hypothetical protein n=1 Tax=Xanthomonas TaxID=338 RepID=UPI000F5901FB|nr:MULTISPECIES: hypothetical protein [Xanthomonas]WLA18130.1 hypothetical protein NDK37_12565 [Xanthomonas citri pv. glycines]WLA27616.1 hypothetical protein NPS81_11775 [Xanthomonas citri pv. glycines]
MILLFRQRGAKLLGLALACVDGFCADGAQSLVLGGDPLDVVGGHGQLLPEQILRRLLHTPRLAREKLRPHAVPPLTTMRSSVRII